MHRSISKELDIAAKAWKDGKCKLKYADFGYLGNDEYESGRSSDKEVRQVILDSFIDLSHSEHSV